MKISLFLSCYNDTLFPEALKATVAVLERLGHEVDVPLAQTCCGQMHFNTGYQQECMPLPSISWHPLPTPRSPSHPRRLVSGWYASIIRT